MSQPPYPPQGGSGPEGDEPGSRGWPPPPDDANQPTEQFGAPDEPQREQTRQFGPPPTVSLRTANPSTGSLRTANPSTGNRRTANPSTGNRRTGSNRGSSTGSRGSRPTANPASRGGPARVVSSRRAAGAP